MPRVSPVFNFGATDLVFSVFSTFCPDFALEPYFLKTCLAWPGFPMAAVACDYCARLRWRAQGSWLPEPKWLRRHPRPPSYKCTTKACKFTVLASGGVSRRPHPPTMSSSLSTPAGPGALPRLFPGIPAPRTKDMQCLAGFDHQLACCRLRPDWGPSGAISWDSGGSCEGSSPESLLLALHGAPESKMLTKTHVRLSDK